MMKHQQFKLLDGSDRLYVKQQRAYEIACLESFFCLSFSDREKYARCLLVIMCIVCVYGHLIFDNGLLQP